MPFQRIAIVNRGEPAMRFINAVAELNRGGGDRLTTIALYTEPDRHAWFVREADEAVCIGPATTFDERAGREAHTYLDHERLERALVAPGADAAWAGWGFVAEHAEFVDLCDKLGVVFIGPSGDAMRRSATRSDPSGWPRQAGSPGRAVERRRRWPTSTRPRRRRAHRLPAVRQGDRRGRRPRHPPGRRTRPSWPAPSRRPGPRPATRSGTRRCSSNGRSRAPATSRSR